MAFLQSELPPSTAPVSTRRTAPTVSRAIPSRGISSKLLARLSIGLVAAALLAILGTLAARETESVPMGILAADLAFLVAVAGWSSVVGGARR